MKLIAITMTTMMLCACGANTSDQPASAVEPAAPSTQEEGKEASGNSPTTMANADTPRAAKDISGNIEKSWVFETVRGFRNGQVLSDTNGIGMFNSVMKGSELRFADGMFTKKTGDLTLTGAYSLRQDNARLSLTENGQQKEFNVIELNSNRLIIQSVDPQMQSLVVIYKVN